MRIFRSLLAVILPSLMLCVASMAHAQVHDPVSVANRARIFYDQEVSKNGRTSRPHSSQTPKYDINGATKVVYTFSGQLRGSDNEYVCTVTLAAGLITMEVYHESVLCYDGTHEGFGRFRDFVINLSRIGLCQDDWNTGTADDGAYLKVYRGSQTVVDGQFGVSLATNNGSVRELIASYLPESMRDIFDNPASTIRPRAIIRYDYD